MEKSDLDPLLKRPAVEALTALSRSTLYKMMSEGRFPRPIRIGARAVAWPQSSIADWIDNRKFESSSGTRT